MRNSMKAALAALTVLAVAAGCRTKPEEPSLAAAVPIGTLVFRSDLADYATTNALSLAEKVAYVRSQSMWIEGRSVLLFSRPSDNIWRFDPATNVNLLAVGREGDLVALWESKYGAILSAE